MSDEPLAQNRDLMQTRIDVAEMKGMLSQVVSNHNARLDQHDKAIDVHEQRLNEKGKTLARHDERLQDLEDDKTAASARTSAAQARVFGVIASAIAAGTLVLAVYNRLTL